MRSLHHNVDVAHTFALTLVLRQRIARATASLVYRLRVHWAFPKRTLYMIDIPDTALIGACEVIENAFNILRFYLLYATYRDELHNSIGSAGRSCTFLQHSLSPPGPLDSVRYVFGELLQFFEESGWAVPL